MPTQPLGLTGVGVYGGTGALSSHIKRIDRLACRQEETIAFGTAKRQIAAHLGDADPAEQFASRVPYRCAAVAECASGIARGPDISLDVAAQPVRPALHAVDQAIGEQFPVRDLVVRSDIERKHLALTARACVTRSLAGARDIQLLEVRRERDAVRSGT